MRVAIILEDFCRWEGGRSYARYLLTVLSGQSISGAETLFFAGRSARYSSLRNEYPLCSWVITSLFDRCSAAWFFRHLLIALTGQDILLRRLLCQERIELVSHNMSIFLKACRSFSLCAWLSDLQHKVIPHHFPWIMRWKRDIWFYFLSRNARTVILSSQAAANDFKKYYPLFSTRAAVLPFAAEVQIEQEIPLEALRKKYDLPEYFFYAPNQFWVHKNHAVLVEALARLKQQKQNAYIVCTGDTRDHRRPGYFAEILKLVKEKGVGDHFLILGRIDRRDVVSLMRHCVAVINPSLFEGWSTSVEEAKSLGKKLLLSDIPVHREQAPERGSYFNPHNPSELSRLLVDALVEFSLATEAEFFDKAQHVQGKRRDMFVENLRQIIFS